MKRFKYLAFLLWMMPLAFGACTDDDNDEITDEEYIAGAAVVNLTVVDGETDLPIAEVTLKQTALKISETTDANGKATLTFDQAPRAVANLVFSHEAYQDYTTTVAIGEVSEGSTKNVEVKIALNPKTVSYVINFTVLDDSTFLPITGVSILGLETGADIFAAEVELPLCLNVNVPVGSVGELKGMKLCRQNRGFWREEFYRHEDPRGREYFWLTGEFVNGEPEATDTDEWALANKYVAVVPVQVDLTDYRQLKNLTKVLK